MATTGRTVHVASEQWYLAWVTIASFQCAHSLRRDGCVRLPGRLMRANWTGCHRSRPYRPSISHGWIRSTAPSMSRVRSLAIRWRVACVDFQPADWGWTALIPGFGLLADEFAEPALKIWRRAALADGWAACAPGIRIPLDPFWGAVGLAPAAQGARCDGPTLPTGWQPGHEAADAWRQTLPPGGGRRRALFPG